MMVRSRSSLASLAAGSVLAAGAEQALEGRRADSRSTGNGVVGVRHATVFV